MKSDLRFWATGVAVLALATFPFFRAWNYGLINLDDYLYITQHPFVCSWQGLESLRQCFTDMTEGIWMPLTYVSYMVDWKLFGEWFGGFHIHSIFLHFVNSCLVLWLFALLFPNRRGLGVLATLVWAVHPLRCESVVFLASRKDLLSFFWEGLALVTWIKGSLASDGKPRYGFSLTALSTLFFVLGSLCKPSVMTFPLLCLLLDAFVLRQIRPLRYVVPVCYMAFLGVFAGIQQSTGGATVDLFNQPLWGRLLSAVAAYGIYLRNFVWPQWLSLQCVTRWPELPRFWFPGLVISSGVAFWLYVRLMPLWEHRLERFGITMRGGLPVAVRCRIEPSPVLAGVLWFSIAIAPMLGIAHFGYHAFADRFTYIPSLGIGLALVGGLGGQVCKWPRTRRCVISLLIAFVLCLMMFCWRQTGFWESDKKMFSHTLEVDGHQNACAHKSLALWHFEFDHDLDACVREFDTSIEQRIEFAIWDYDVYIAALSELGRTERIAERIKYFDRTLEKLFGHDYYSRVLRLDPTIKTEHLRLAEIYRFSKIAWLLSDVNDLAAAREMIDETERMEAFRDSNFLLYLKYRLAVLSGNREEADARAEDLLQRAHRDGFLRFRFLAKTD